MTPEGKRTRRRPHNTFPHYWGITEDTDKMFVYKNKLVIHLQRFIGLELSHQLLHCIATCNLALCVLCDTPYSKMYEYADSFISPLILVLFQALYYRTCRSSIKVAQHEKGFKPLNGRTLGGPLLTHADTNEPRLSFWSMRDYVNAQTSLLIRAVSPDSSPSIFV